ncbi:helix-turn-helix domain-containing protein [Endozoicomonas sp. Mp262]|uniref:helix-turn-helix domain-containing protein n=1 Tax=Endozoicomonas sp. Mp262 TaxID=2919499 RepID=UPI0021DB4F84
MVLKVSPEKWNQTRDCLLQQSIHASHPRTRERFSALYQVSQGDSASNVAKQLGRRLDTVTNWIHLYHDSGPEAMIYKRTGGRPPFAK